MKTPADVESLLARAPRPQPPAELLPILERDIKLPVARAVRPISWLSWRRIWIPLSGLGALGALAISLSQPFGSRRTPVPVSPSPSSVEISLVSASEDRAGTWGVFEPGLGDDNGNGIAIANDWGWKANLRLNETKSIKRVQIHEEGSNQIWTTVDPIHWPLVVFKDCKQLNDRYGEVLGPFPAGLHQLELYGQVDNRKMYGTDLLIEFSDGTRLQAKIPRSNISIGQSSQPMLTPEAPAPVIYGSAAGSTPSRLVVDVGSEPVITCLRMLECGRIDLEARGVPGQTYALESATNLVPPVIWRPMATNTAGSDGTFGFSDTKMTNVPACFYRLHSP